MLCRYNGEVVKQVRRLAKNSIMDRAGLVEVGARC